MGLVWSFLIANEKKNIYGFFLLAENQPDLFCLCYCDNSKLVATEVEREIPFQSREGTQRHFGQWHRALKFNIHPFKRVSSSHHHGVCVGVVVPRFY